MRLCGARSNACKLQQMFADQVRQVAFHAAQAQVNAGLAEINWLELRVAIGHVQERHIAKFRDVIKTVGCRSGIGIGVSAHA